MGMLGRQSVLDRDDDRVHVFADRGRDRVFLFDVTQDHPATMDEVDPGQRPGRVHRPVDPHLDVRRALRPGNRPVLRGHVGVGRDRDGRQHLRHDGPALHDVGDGVETAWHDLKQLIKGFAYIRVDEVATGHEPSSVRTDAECILRR
jgi:hypothetical protein